MAYRKVDDASLTAVADAIRERSGTTDPMAFPDGFVSAVAAIPGGIPEADMIAMIDRTITHIDVPYGCTIIGWAAFRNSALRTINFPDAVTTISAQAFYQCGGLGAIALPPNLRKIEGNAFQECRQLQISRIPASVETIDGWAFYACTGITSLTFDGTPTSINAEAFLKCNNLAVINVPWSEGAVANAPWGAPIATINYDYDGG